MATLSLTNYNSYEKCGDILKSSEMGEEQQKYVLLCFLCQKICLQFETFVEHIEQQHQHQNNNLINHINNTKGEIELFCEANDDADCDTPKIEEIEVKEDKKVVKVIFMLDPLEEPEVMIVAPNTLENISMGEYEAHANTNKCVKEFNEEPAEDKRTLSKNDNIQIEGSKPYYYGMSECESERSDLEVAEIGEKSFTYNQIHEDIDDSVIIFYKTENSMKKVKHSKKKLLIEKFMAKRLNVLTLISAYKQQEDLWDNTRPPKLKNRCRKKRQHALTQIVQDVKSKASLSLSLDELNRIIKYLRVRYIRELRLRLQGHNHKDDKEDYQPLWFYDHMEFLKPTLNFIQEMEDKQLLTKTELSEQQIIVLIDIYKNYPCLWDEQDIYYNSEKSRQHTLNAMQCDINKKLNMNYSLPDVLTKIDFLHKMAKTEKEQQINKQQLNNIAEYNQSKSSTSKNKFFEQLSFLLPHVGPFKCTYCSKLITNVYTYRKHIANHDGSKPFKCAVCQHEFSQKPGYIIHLRRHTQDFPFVCKFCSRGFPCKKELMLHFQNHPEYEKQYICDICGDGFTQQKLLGWHIKVHNNTRDSICNVCGKGFTNSKLLFQHRTVHSKEKSICKLCGKTYAHYRGLSRHMNKDHETTIAAVAGILGGKPRKRVLNINAKTPSVSIMPGTTPVQQEPQPLIKMETSLRLKEVDEQT